MSALRRVAALGLVLSGGGASVQAVRASPPEAPAALRASAPRPPLPPPAPVVHAAMPPVRETTLASGLRLVVIEHHRRPVLGVYLLLPGGSVADPPGCAGASRLALQLVGDLHERSVTGEELVGEKSFREQVMNMGGAVTLATSPDVSLVAFQGYPQDAGAYFRLLAEALLRPRHGEESFTERRNQALDALEDVEAADPEALQRALREAAFGPGQPYARSEVGTTGDLSRLGLEDVVARQRSLLVPGGATLLVIGDVRTDRVLTDASAAFRRWVARSPLPPPGRGARTARSTGVTFIRRQPASTLMACAARDLTDVKISDAELQLLAAVLGKGMHSRLMLSLREAEGISYTASADLVRYRHARALLACAPVAGARGDDGVRLLRRALEELRSRPPDEGEVDRARALLEAEREGELEDAGGLADVWIDALARGLSAPQLEEERAALARVTAADVQRAARLALQPGAVRWILSGDTVVAGSAAAANGLGPLRPLALGR